MFLKEVYRHSRWMFAGMLFFIAAQLAVNLKKGMVFSPFFHYGMYSGRVVQQQTYRIATVTLDADTLKGSHFSPPQWDKIHYTLQQVLSSGCDSHFYHSQVKRLYGKAGFGQPAPEHFINQGTANNRLETYRQWLSVQLDMPGSRVGIVQGRYHLINGRLKLLAIEDSLIASNHLCH